MFDNSKDSPVLLSRTDPEEPLSACSRHGFNLDGEDWPSVEHYYQAMKFDDAELRSQIRQALDPAAAAKLGRRNKRRARADWESVRRVMMTRAVYIKCRTFPVIAERLLATGSRPIIENSQYDYYWGCGRDMRGHNTYGRVLMEVREKLRELNSDR